MQTAMCDIQESTTCLIDQVLTYVKQQVVATLDPCEKNHQAELLKALDNIPAPFLELKLRHYMQHM